MDYLEIDQIPSLRKPVLISAFAGWNDAGQAATTAVRFLGERWEAVRFASIDSEEFFDFTSAVPDPAGTGSGARTGVAGQLFLYHELPDQSRDALLLLGPAHLSGGPSLTPCSSLRGSAG